MAAIQEKSSKDEGLHARDEHRLVTPGTNFASSAEKHLDLNDPEHQRIYEIYRPETMAPKIRGIEVLKIPEINKVCMLYK